MLGSTLRLFTVVMLTGCSSLKLQSTDFTSEADMYQPFAVPFYSQLDNINRPHSTCSVTSLAMVTDFYAITLASESLRVPDQLYQRFGLLQTVPALQQGFNALAAEAGSPMRAHSLEHGTLIQLQAELAAGRPVIVHGWFTPPGHIVVVTGFDEGHYIVHDPYGRWDLQKRGSYDSSVSGENIRYPQAAFEYAINDNGTGDDLWLHMFRSTNDWPASGQQIHQTALLWQGQDYRLGQPEQSGYWTRTVLQAACGAHFATLQTMAPWDLHLLGTDDDLHQGHGNSLASDEFGLRIEQIEDLQPGDLVFLQNTFGNWAEGVITHVGIATGNGQYMHRLTANQGLVKTEAIPAADFQAGLRLRPELCSL